MRVTLKPGDVRGGRLRRAAFERLAGAAIVSGVVDEVRVWRRGEGLVRYRHGPWLRAHRTPRAPHAPGRFTPARTSVRSGGRT